MRLPGVGVVVVNAFSVRVECAEADDDDVNVRFAAGFAFPCERAMGEVDLQVVALEEFVPENADLLALADGVGGDEADMIRVF